MKTLPEEEVLRLWRHRPKIFIKDVFGVTLDAWQEEVVDLYIKGDRTAMVASKGPGKTFLLAMLVWHFFVCHYQPKIAVLSITKDHLKSNLWAELLKWRNKSPLLQAMSNDGAERITLKGHEGYSFIDARSFPKEADPNKQAGALAGLHSDNVMYAIDEAGGIPDAVLATADAALSTGTSEDGTKVAKLLVSANPEEPRGMIYKAYLGKLEAKWNIYCINGDPDDPKRAPRVDIRWARDQIAMFGKDDPWVIVNVFGRYPETASNKLLSETEVAEAMRREIKDVQVKNQQFRMGLDVSRGGVDRTVFAPRRGLKVYPLIALPSTLDSNDLAGKATFYQQDMGIERLFVDNTGGYGSGVVDNLKLFPHLDVTPVIFNARAQDEVRYFNKRTEMYMRLRDHVKNGGSLPNDKELEQELCEIKVLFSGGKTRIEEKDEIKKRLNRSPDRADAVALTFADVEQPSFFADFSGRPQKKYSDMSYEEKLDLYNSRTASRYISDQSQIDNRHPYAPNYSA